MASTSDPAPFEAFRRSGGVTSTEHRTARGKAVLDAWERSRAPFLLYLRSFRATMYHGSQPGDHVLFENHLWATLSLYPPINVLTVVDPNEVPLPGSYGHGAPALAVSDDHWPTVVSDLIGKAEIIISEVPLLTEGARFELDECAKQGKVGQTVVMIPPPGGPFPLLDDDKTIASFPRVMWADEVLMSMAKERFVLQDLIARAGAIARLDPSERLRMVDANETSTRFPLTFAGLREGYERTSVEYERQGDLGKASRAAFRALVVASMKITLEAEGLIAASDDETARIDIAGRVAHLNLLMGNRSGALNYLKGAVDLAAKAGDEARRQKLEEQLREVETSS